MSYVALAQMAYGGYQAYQGDQEAKKGEAALRIANAKKNKSAIEKQKRLEASKNFEMPGMARREANLDKYRAERITAAKEAGTTSANQQAMIALAELDRQDAQGKLAVEDEQFKQDRQMDAIEGLDDMAALEEQARQRDIDFAEGQMAKGEAQKGAGTQNIMGGATTVIGGLESGSGDGEKQGGDGEKQGKLTKGQKKGRRAERRYAREEGRKSSFGNSGSRSRRRDERRRSRRSARYEADIDRDFVEGGDFYNG